MRNIEIIKVKNFLCVLIGFLGDFSLIFTVVISRCCSVAPMRGVLWHGKFILPLNRGGIVGIFRNSQVIENHAWRKAELPHFLSDITYAFAFKEADSESPQSGDVFRAVTF